MMNRFNYILEGRFLEKSIVSFRIILLVGFTAGLAFGIEEAIPNSYIRELNFMISILSIILFVISFRYYQIHEIQLLLFIYIVIFNLINLIILFRSDLDVVYGFEYLVLFILSSLLFSNRTHFNLNLFINSIALIVIVFISHSSFNELDFMFTYLFALIAVYLIGYRRFFELENIKQTEAQFRMLADNSGDMICTHRRGGRFTFISPSAESLFGYEPNFLLNKNPAQFIHPSDVIFFENNFFNALDKEKINKPIQYRFKNSNGDFIWVETIVRAIGGNDSIMEELPYSYVSTTRNFQHHKEYENQILEKSIQLEQKNKEIEMFAYITSHDMQEPLRMITNYLQLVQSKLQKMGDTSMDDFINYTLSSAKNLQSLIRDILVYSTSDKINIPTTASLVESVINEIVADLQMVIIEKDVEIVLTEDMGSVLADRNSLRQIFQNLLLNAIKYNNSQKPTIHIACDKIDSYNIYSISDNGIGIDKIYWDKVFEPFQRLHGKSEHSGTGLGLPICKKMITCLGGDIWLDSTVSKGTTFYVKLRSEIK